MRPAVFAGGAGGMGVRTVAVDAGAHLHNDSCGHHHHIDGEGPSIISVSGAGALRLDAGIEILLGRS